MVLELWQAIDATVLSSYFVGSLYIESLGMLTSASDHETMLLPVGIW